MQPNLPQDEKFNYAAQAASVMARYLALSDRATGPGSSGVRDVTHLIWPDSAFPFFLQREPDAMAQIADLLPPGAVLIVGAARPAVAAPSPAICAPTIRSTRSITTARSSASTTSCISSRSANTCRSRISSKASG